MDHNSLETTLGYNLDQMTLMNQGSLWPFYPSWELQKYYAVSDYFFWVIKSRVLRKVCSKQFCFIRCRMQKKKNFMAPFCGWGSTVSRLEPLWGGSLLFTTKFPEIPGTHFIDLRRMKSWVDLVVTQWFCTRDLWIGNPTP